VGRTRRPLGRRNACALEEAHAGPEPAEIRGSQRQQHRAIGRRGTHSREHGSADSSLTRESELEHEHSGDHAGGTVGAVDHQSVQEEFEDVEFWAEPKDDESDEQETRQAHTASEPTAPPTDERTMASEDELRALQAVVESTAGTLTHIFNELASLSARVPPLSAALSQHAAFLAAFSALLRCEERSTFSGASVNY
jgi:hypothetical protein